MRITVRAAEVHLADPTHWDLVAGVLDAALEAVEPEAATRRALAGRDRKPDVILALGKAAPAMTRAALAVCGVPAGPVVVVSDHREEVPTGELLIGSHPLPDSASLAAGRRLLAAAREGGQVLFLASGGGSALAEVPAPGIDLSDLATTYGRLLQRGVPIDETNTVRCQLSSLKGGRLAAAASGPVATVLISDVGPRPHLVASGPTLPCPTRPTDALTVLERRGLLDQVPEPIIQHLSRAAPPPQIEPGEVLVAADGSGAAEAAAEEARRRGYRARLLTTDMRGEAATTALWMLGQCPRGVVTVAAGETTVEVTGSGTGGRNQEAALRAALAIEGTATIFASLGTDGVDGPTDAAGAVVDGETARRVRRAGIDPWEALAANDSHRALAAAGALIRTGPTGTNVADLWVVVA